MVHILIHKHLKTSMQGQNINLSEVQNTSLSEFIFFSTNPMEKSQESRMSYQTIYIARKGS